MTPAVSYVVVQQIVPPSYRHRFGHAERIERASERPLRTRNKLYYRFLHWPIWIWVFFIAPGPITFGLFAEGPGPATLSWLAIVVVGTAVAGLLGRLPGVEPKPLILRFTEDRPNPLHRRICYTLAWSEIIAYALLNIAGLVDAIVNGEWRMRTIYDAGYLPIAASVWIMGLIGWLPRAGWSTRGEGIERRYFYGAVWAVALAQPLLWLLWKQLPQTTTFDVVKLVAFVGTLVVVGDLARRGILPRTRPILPDELIVFD